MAAVANAPKAPGGSDLGWLVVLGAIWGSAFPVIRAGLVAGASPIFYGAARFALAAGAMLAVAAAIGGGRPDRRTAALSALYGGVLAIGGYAAFLYVGEEYISGGLAAVFVATAPLSSALVARAVLPSDRIGRLGAVGLAAGFAGVVVLLFPSLFGGARGAAIGGLLAFGAAAMFAIGSVLLRRSIPSATSPWGLTVQFATASAVLGVVAISPIGGTNLPLTSGVLVPLAWLAAVPSVLGYTIFFRLHHRIGPTQASLVAYVNPVVGVVVGIAVFGESVTANEVAGFLVIVSGLLLLQWDRRGRATGPSHRDP